MSSTLPKIGDLIADKYRLVSKIGSGGYGVVFRAFHETMGRDVAIKMLRPEANQQVEEVERFKREVYHASGLKHPNTITLYDYGQTSNGLLYIVMEYLKGMNLGQWLKRHGVMSHDDAMLMMEQIIRSLREAHEQGIIHRDLKPENIFIHEISSDEITVKVLDFGLSKAIGRRRREQRAVTKEGQAYGTPQYMSPEQACAMKLTAASDVYALGLLGYEMLMGKPAFDDKSPMAVLLKQVNDPLPPLHEHLQGSIVDDFSRHCARKKVVDRFDSAGEALAWWLKRKAQDSSTSSIQSQVILPASIAHVPEQVAQSSSPKYPTASSLPWFELQDAQQLDAREIDLRLAQMPMIGRQMELEQLLQWGQQALTTGGCLWLTGDTGVGKSRLIDEWLRHMEMHAVIVLQGNHLQDGPALGGLKQALAPLFSSENTLPTMSFMSDEHLKNLKQVIDPDLPFEYDRDPNQDWAFACIEQPLHHMAKFKPIVFVLEDMQWADDFTTKLVKHWQAAMASYTSPLLLVFTQHSNQSEGNSSHMTRTSRRHDTFAHTHFLHLKPLSADNAKTLVEELLPLEDALQMRMISTARGNPLYMTQMVRYLVSQHLLVQDDQTRLWSLDDDQQAMQLLPPELENLLIKRITGQIQKHRLGAVLEAILLRAMIIGHQFEIRLLKAFLQREGRGDLEAYLDDAIDAFTHSNVLISTAIDGRPALEFGYEMLRASLLETHKWADESSVQIHAIAAQTKKHFYTQHQRDVDIYAHEIAHHFVEANQPAEGLDWYFKAAQLAENLQDFKKSIHYLRNAARLLNQSLDPDGERLLEIRIKEGKLHRYLGDFGPAEDALREAMEETRRVGDVIGESMTGEALADLLILMTRYDEARGIYDHVEQMHIQFQNQGGILRCRLGKAEISRYQGRYDQARKVFLNTQDEARAIDAVPLIIKSLFGIGQCAYAQGDLAQAQSYLKRARKLSETQGDVLLRSNIDLELAILSIHTEHIEQIVPLVQNAFNIKQSIGDTLGLAQAHLVMGLCLRRTQRLELALHHAQRARALNAKLSHVYGIAKAVLLEAEILFLMGKLEDSRAKTQDAEKLHEDIGDAHGMVIVMLHYVHCEVELGLMKDAQKHMRRAALLIKAHHAALYRPSLLFAQGLIAEGEGLLEDAVGYFDEALQRSQEIHRYDIESLAAVSLAKLHLVMGDLHAARQESPLALERAESLGYIPSLVYALTLNTIVARVDGHPNILASNIRRLRVLHDGATSLDLRVSERLQHLVGLIKAHQTHTQSYTFVMAIIEVLQALGYKQAANRLSIQLNK